MKCPCKDCNKRTLTCHSMCRDYTEWREWKEELNRKIWLDRDASNTHIESAVRTLRDNFRSRRR